MIVFAQPFALLWLVAVVPLAIAAARRSGGLAAALKAIAAAALALAIAGPFASTADSSMTTVVIVSAAPAAGPIDTALRDARSEAGPGGRLVAYSNRAEAIDARIADDPAAIALLRQRLARPVEADDPPEGGAALAAALRLAGTLVPASGAGRIVLISDGQQTRGDAAAETHRLAARGIAVAARPRFALPPDAPTVLVRSVAVPPARVGQTVPVVITIEAAADTDATVQIDAGGPARLVRLHAGLNAVTIDVPLPKPGLTTLTATAHAGDGPASSAAGAVDVGGPLRVGVFADADDTATPALAALLGPAARVQRIDPAALERDDALAELDVAVLSDLPADRLSPAVVGRFRDAVTRRGLGLWVTGAARSFGPGGYADSGLADLLPVRAVQPLKNQDPSAALVLVIDTSGSMKGPRIGIAKEIARLAIRRLQPHDKVGIVEFYGNKRWAAPLQSAGNAAELSRALNRLDAGGGTVILPAIEEAIYGLKNANARARHVLILTDGGVEDGPFEPLIRRAAEEGISVSTVLCGPGDSPFLQSLAEWGHGRFYAAPDRFGIPEMILRQPQTSLPPPLVQTPTALAIGDDPLAAALAAVPMPPIDGYVRTTARPAADVALRTTGGDAILARWQCGAGAVVALPTQLGSAWGSELTNDPRLAALLAGVLRATARDRNAVRLTPTVRPAGLEIDARAADPTATALPFPLTFVALDVTGNPIRTAAAEPIAAGRWNVLLDGLAAGPYRVETRSADGTTLGSTAASVPVPRAIAALRPDTELLDQMNDIAASAESHRATDGTREIDLRPTLIVVAVLAFLAHVFARRWPVRTAQLSRTGIAIIAITLIAIAADARAATTQPADDLQRALRDGGDAADVLARLKSATPPNAAALADAAVEQGDLTTAVAAVRQLQTASPHDANVAERLASLLEATGDDRGAAAMLETAIAAQTEPAAAGRLRARLHLLQIDTGRPAGVAAAGSDVGDGVAAYLLGDAAGAKAALTGVAAAGVDGWTALLLRGDLALRGNRPGEAAAAFEAALPLAVQPRDRKFALERVVAARRAAGQMPALADAWLGDPHLPNDRLLPLAGVLRELGRVDALLTLWRRPAANAEGDAVLRSAALANEVIGAAAAAGRNDAARAVCQAMLDREPLSEQWLAALVRVQIDAGDPAAADDTLARQRPAWEAAGRWYRLASVARDAGRYDVSVAVCQAAQAKDGADAVDAALLLAGVRQQQGNRDAAQHALEQAKAAAVSAGDFGRIRAVAEAMEQAGARGQAIELLQMCVKQSAADDVSRRLSWLLEQAGRLPEAQAIWAGLWAQAKDAAAKRTAGQRWIDLAAKTGTLADLAAVEEEKLTAGHASADDLSLLIDIYVGVGDAVSAAEILQQFKSLAGSDADVLRQLADLYLRTERFGLAARTLQRLVDARPAKAIDTLQEIAVLALERNRPDDAEKALSEISRRSGVTPAEAELRGGIFDRLDRPLDAAHEYRKALAADPTQAENWLLWAAAMVKAKQRPAAVGRLQMLVETAANEDAFVTAVDGLLNVDAPPAALRVARRRLLARIAAAPQRMLLYEVLADVCDALGDTAMSARAVRATLPIAGEQRSDKVRQLFTAEQSAGDTAQAADDGRLLIALGDAFPAQLFLDLGRQLLDAGRPAEADRAFARAAEAADDDDTLRRIAAAYEAGGANAQAARTLNRLIARRPFDAPTLLELAQLDEETGQADAAARAYTAALSLVLRRATGEVAAPAAPRAKNAEPVVHVQSEADQLLEPVVAGAIATARTPLARTTLLDAINALATDELKRLAMAKAGPSVTLDLAARTLRRAAFALGSPEVADTLDRAMLAAWPARGELRTSVVNARVTAGLLARAQDFADPAALPEPLRTYAAVHAPATQPADDAMSVERAARLLPQLIARGQADAARAVLSATPHEAGKAANQALPVIVAAAAALGDADAADAFATLWYDAIAADPRGGSYALSAYLRTAWPAMSGTCRTAILSRVRASVSMKAGPDGAQIAMLLLRAADLAGLGDDDRAALATRAAHDPFLMGRTLSEMIGLSPAAARATVLQEALSAASPQRRRPLLLDCVAALRTPSDVALIDAFAAGLAANPPLAKVAAFGGFGGSNWATNAEQIALLQRVAPLAMQQAGDDAAGRLTAATALATAQDAQADAALLAAIAGVRDRLPAPRPKEIPAYLPRPELSALPASLIALSPAARVQLIGDTLARPTDPQATNAEQAWRGLIDATVLRTLGRGAEAVGRLTAAFRRQPQDGETRRALLRWLELDGREAGVVDLLAPYLADASVVDSEARSSLERAAVAVHRFDVARQLTRPNDELAKATQRLRLAQRSADPAAFLQAARAMVVQNRTRLRALVPVMPAEGVGGLVEWLATPATGARGSLYTAMAADPLSAGDLRALLETTPPRDIEFPSLLDAVADSAAAAGGAAALLDELSARVANRALTAADGRLVLTLAMRPGVRVPADLLTAAWDTTVLDDSIVSFVALRNALTQQSGEAPAGLANWVRVARPILAETLPPWAGALPDAVDDRRPGELASDGAWARRLNVMADAGRSDAAEAQFGRWEGASQIAPQEMPAVYLAAARLAARRGDVDAFRARLRAVAGPWFESSERPLDVRLALPPEPTVDQIAAVAGVLGEAAVRHPAASAVVRTLAVLGSVANARGQPAAAAVVLGQAVALSDQEGDTEATLWTADLARQLGKSDVADAIEVRLLKAGLLPVRRADGVRTPSQGTSDRR